MENGMMAALRKTRLLGMIAMVFLLSLGSFPAAGVGSEPAPEAGRSTVLDHDRGHDNLTYNNYGCFIAGISNREGPLAPCEIDPAWVRYARFMDRSWKSFETRQLAPMRAWVAQELGPVTASTVFYPFSGPDFINIYTFFPHAKTYLMVAMEPVGEIPDFSAPDKKNFFACLQRSLYDLLQLNFFLTEKMETSLGEQELDGTLPVLMFFLAREKARILDVRYWALKADGSVEEVPAWDCKEARRGGCSGVRIDFVSAGGSETQTLYYLRCNLRNNSLERKPQFVAFLKSFGPMATFAKAASYLMFKPHFSAIRRFILEQSLYVLQTDSAIPLKYFDPSEWNLKFYGTYQGPIPLFKCWYQKDLAAVYKRGQDIYHLPFGIGYRFRVNTSNLIFASKR
jgi:hypothetical protein